MYINGDHRSPLLLSIHYYLFTLQINNGGEGGVYSLSLVDSFGMRTRIQSTLSPVFTVGSNCFSRIFDKNYIIILYTFWRRGWDSNPRYGHPHANFQDWCLKPTRPPLRVMLYYINTYSAQCQLLFYYLDRLSFVDIILLLWYNMSCICMCHK